MKSVVTAVLAILVVSQLSAQVAWEKMNGPFGGSVENIARLSNGTLFASSAAGVYKSTDVGATWTRSSNGLDGQVLHRIAANTSNNYLFIGTDSGMFRSTDMGASWNKSGLGAMRVYKIALKTDGHVFVTTNGVAQKSSDNGATWSDLGSGAAYMYGNLIYVKSDGKVFFAGQNAMNVSTDNGATWNYFGGNVTMRFLDVFFSGDQAFAGGTDAVYWSQFGTSWSKVLQFTGNVPAIAIQDDGSFLAGSNNLGVMRSTDYGSHWISAGSGIKGVPVNSFTLLTDGTVLAATATLGVMRSIDRGATFTGASVGIGGGRVVSLAKAPDGSILAGGISRAFRSTDNGLNWSSVDTAFGPNYTTVSVNALLFVGPKAVAGTTLGVFTADASSLGIWNVQSALFSSQINKIIRLADGRLAAGINSGVKVSSDTGKTWTNLGSSSSLMSANVVSLIQTNDGTIFAGTLDNAPGTLFRCTDGGFTWTAKSFGSTNSQVFSLAADSAGTIYAATYVGVQVSTDNGSTWSLKSSGLPSFPRINSMIVTAGGIVYAAAASSAETGDPGYGVYRSTNKGTTWTAVNSGLSAMNTSSLLELADGRVLLGTRTGGVFRTSGTAAVGESPSPAPASFSLEQNYPNPFNPSTEIRYSLSSAQFVTLAVYDLLGREVARLVDGMKPAGSYTVAWNAAQIPSGLYFCRVTAGGASRTMKMMLVR